MHSRHASPFSLQRLNERWRWMGVHNAANKSEQACTNPDSSGRDIHRQLDPIHLFFIQLCTSPIWRQREPISQKAARLYLHWEEADVRSNDRPLHILYISSARSVCIPVFLCQRGFPFESVRQSWIGRGKGADRDMCKNICIWYNKQ